MGDQQTYKIGVVQDPEDPTFNANNEDLKEIPTDWSIKTRVAKEVGWLLGIIMILVGLSVCIMS